MLQKNEFGQVIDDAVPDWQLRKRPSFDVLRGKHWSVVPLDIDRHAERLFTNLALKNRGESWTYLSYGPFPNCAQFCLWLKKHSQKLIHCFMQS